ncbi:SAM domain-containing protein SAMSN-1 [Larimichthys crocea]|uniref:SAM domain-containing protein SAMSN-1 n=1 Tax=Larimichthys crocea TaxID=215358 RepID=A0A6G0IA45_LARCR|nr:SAM domain-containing protein SAMSN-1 [Larimichthys crocea]
MNLFCFTLEGSTESIYQPACSQTLKEVIPEYQCSPVLLKPEWDGSDPSIHFGGEAAADTAESIHATGRLKKLQNLMQTKKGPGKVKSPSEDKDHLLSNNNPVLTCIGLGKTTKQQQQQTKDECSEEEGVCSPRLGNYLWSPFECPQPWTPFYHTCHQPRHELWVCGGALSLPRTTEWDRFESLIQELDSKQSDPPQTTCSISDPQPSQNTQNPTKLKLQRKETETSSLRDRKHIKASAEKTDSHGGNPQRDEAEKREVGGGGSFSIGHRRSGISLDSLYSLNSGQSSSSGVTSGSDYSSNRGSLRLEDDLLYTGQFCGRARVHTDFVPSPYDSESLKLKVGDVIDIIIKPPMGIWTGVLNGRMGNFKFVYVDEYSSSLQLNGYQTVDDLMRLREHHLTDLNVTDPEHRHRLLAAVDSLQQLTDRQLENEANQEAETPGENMKADTNNCPRDSGCHMPSDSPDNSAEDTHLHFISEYPLTAETTAS